jgi:hypothetical protein
VQPSGRDSLRSDQVLLREYVQETLTDALVGGWRPPQIRHRERHAAVTDQAVYAIVRRIRGHEVPVLSCEHLLHRLPGTVQASGAGGGSVNHLVDQGVLLQQLAAGREGQHGQTRFGVRTGEGLDGAQRDQDVPEPTEQLHN